VCLYAFSNNEDENSHRMDASQLLVLFRRERKRKFFFPYCHDDFQVFDFVYDNANDNKQ
jgi:hypothetical protein